ncbi:MAG: hypothetical protein QW434_07480 [Pyrobaculum sp.]
MGLCIKVGSVMAQTHCLSSILSMSLTYTTTSQSHGVEQPSNLARGEGPVRTGIPIL